MDFKTNTAYLFDSKSWKNQKSSFYNVISYTGNDVVIDSLINELINKYDIKSITSEDISSWLEEDDNITSLLNLLHLMSMQKNRLSITSSFVEKDYGLFMFITGMLLSTINSEDKPTFDDLEFIYETYSITKKQTCDSESLVQRFDIIDNILNHQIQHYNKYKKFESIYSNNRLKVLDFISKVDRFNHEYPDEFLLSEYVLYTKQYLNIYKVNQIENIYSLGATINNILFAYKIRGEAPSPTIKAISQDNIKDNLLLLSESLFKVIDYIFTKLNNIEDINEMTEDDKCLFIAVWLLFQGENCDWILSPSLFGKIKTLFSSIEKDIKI